MTVRDPNLLPRHCADVARLHDVGALRAVANDTATEPAEADVLVEDGAP